MRFGRLLLSWPTGDPILPCTWPYAFGSRLFFFVLTHVVADSLDSFCSLHSFPFFPSRRDVLRLILSLAFALPPVRGSKVRGLHGDRHGAAAWRHVCLVDARRPARTDRGRRPPSRRIRLALRHARLVSSRFKEQIFSNWPGSAFRLVIFMMASSPYSPFVCVLPPKGSCSCSWTRRRRLWCSTFGICCFGTRRLKPPPCSSGLCSPSSKKQPPP